LCEYVKFLFKFKYSY